MNEIDMFRASQSSVPMQRDGLARRLRRAAVQAATALAVILLIPGPAGWAPRPALAAEYVNRPSITIAPGVQLPLTLSAPIERVAIGDPETVTGRVVGPNDILLLGLKPGRTNLIVWEVGGERAYVYPVVVPLSTADLERNLHDDPELTGVRADASGGKVALKGTVASNEAHTRALLIAARYFPDGVNDQIKVTQQQMVSVEVKFAAISTTTLKRLGFNFLSGPSNSLEYALVDPGGGLTGSIEGVSPLSDALSVLLRLPGSDLSAVLSVLSGAKLAQVLAEPTLLVRSGESAEFIAGGEIPIPVPQNNSDTITIEFKEFGIRLKVAATVLSPNRILLQLAPEVSALDFGQAITIQGTQIPAITRRGASTTIELGNGQSFVLAGLLSSSIDDADDAVPWLGDLPIIGAFFKRQQVNRERQELIIVATPRLVSPLSPNAIPPLPGSDLQNYDPSQGDMLLGRNRLRDVLPQYGLMP
ncbi:type II and III secretion system protein family protein [Oleomonas cavernae]|uniref:Type II and III secretion system protein family protein n=1 Tax=Oleomonas cavernae TaxID=2320859 RepID=A0A418WFE2_9PROT|nr:pilus assembly protein N-terminal domain-containing protein [Oleomonas cavernae]RJF88745.1 type II and III secretion system protein family protein [Oleomonas cavernae]